MENLLEICIYLLAVFGIIITSISFYEMFDLKKYINNSYRIFSNNKFKDKKKIDVIIKIKGLNEEEIKELVEDIKDGSTILKEISNNIIIEKQD